jgi:hypothetical protein
VHSRHVISRLWPELEMTAERIEEIAAHITDFSLAYLREIAPEPEQTPEQIKRRKRK